MRKVQVHCDDRGRILSVLEVADSEGLTAGIEPAPGHQVHELVLDAEHESLGLFELHTRFRVETGGSGPRLVEIAPARRGGGVSTGAGHRYEASVHPGEKGEMESARFAELDIDRVPDPEGGFRALIELQEAGRLVEAGYEVRLHRFVPRQPLDPNRIVDDDAAQAWLEDAVQDVRPKEGD
jgi:hypothetical protein